MKTISYLGLALLIIVISSFKQKVDDKITVYGNIHVNTFGNDSPEQRLKIFNTQNWLHKNVSEKIVIAEGLNENQEPYGVDMLISKYLERYPRHTKDYAKKVWIGICKQGLNVVVKFIFEKEKNVFGGENKALYEKIRLDSKIDQNVLLHQENLDARSAAILENAIRVSKKYPGQKVAIIIGKRHLSWFKAKGYKVLEPDS